MLKYLKYGDFWSLLTFTAKSFYMPVNSYSFEKAIYVE